ncbi:calmodulin-binding protein 60 B-like isoform X2 [Magnolia sinica]|uniref:calmodulin-binding protein 60 B-like isoform X2 n=1 Tax=Magnolia sinica TaxID=86752 RepID=UPI00265B0902|nr:calmodulin-binding protein 60 B-like isoform X2 [Magnolia sinica]
MFRACKSNHRKLMGRPSIPVGGRESTDAEQPTTRATILVPGLESIIRRGVRAGVDDAIQRILHSHRPRPIISPIQSNVESLFELHFDCKLKKILYTGDKIAEGDEPIRIVIRNASTKETITSGPLSSIKIKITVLDGDFTGNKRGYWTMEFKELSPRDGKEALLKGLVETKLKDGVGYFNDLTFTDNSHRTRKGKFMLGVQSTYAGERIKGATSEAFAVKDRRVKPSKEPESLSLTDEVWHLKNIKKDGAFHKGLKNAEINTVLQFLWHLLTDCDRLRKVIGSRMPEKKWKETVEHAQKCFSDNPFCLHNGSSFPQLQASPITGSGLGQQNLDSLIPHLDEPAAELNFQSPAGQNEFKVGPSQLNDPLAVQNVHLIQGHGYNSIIAHSMPISGLQAFPTAGLGQENPNSLITHQSQENSNLLITHQNESTAQRNSMDCANHNDLMVGLSQHNDIVDIGYQLQSQPSDPILGQNNGCGYKSGIGEFSGQQSPMDDAEHFVASIWAIGEAKRKWYKVGAVLMLAARKPIDKAKRRKR